MCSCCVRLCSGIRGVLCWGVSRGHCGWHRSGVFMLLIALHAACWHVVCSWHLLSHNQLLAPPFDPREAHYTCGECRPLSFRQSSAASQFQGCVLRELFLGSYCTEHKFEESRGRLRGPVIRGCKESLGVKPRSVALTRYVPWWYHNTFFEADTSPWGEQLVPPPWHYPCDKCIPGRQPGATPVDMSQLTTSEGGSLRTSHGDTTHEGGGSPALSKRPTQAAIVRGAPHHVSL